jgi:hypothetical protein
MASLFKIVILHRPPLLDGQELKRAPPGRWRSERKLDTSARREKYFSEASGVAIG